MEIREWVHGRLTDDKIEESSNLLVFIVIAVAAPKYHKLFVSRCVCLMAHEVTQLLARSGIIHM